MTPPEPSAFGTLSLEHASTVDRVVEELRRAVFDGELASGTALREVALAESLGVSRSTVREALAVLVGEGLATREPNRGVHVARADPDSVRDVCRARAVLEEAGVRRWPEAPEQLRDEVRRALADYAVAVADDASYRQLNERHLAIHRSLVGLLDSPRLVATAESLSAELRLALAQIDRDSRNAHDHAGSHQQILDLLERDDVDGAADRIRHHLADAEVAILAALGPRGA